MHTMWESSLLERSFILAVIVLLCFLFLKRKRKLSVIICIVVTLLLMLVPERWGWQDGGTVQYWAPLYTVIEWRPNGKHMGTNYYLFPNNFIPRKDRWEGY